MKRAAFDPHPRSSSFPGQLACGLSEKQMHGVNESQL